MNHLPDEILECIFGAFYNPKSQWEEVQREQASHAALSRTCKRLHLVGTEMLFKNGPCLDTTTQVKRFRSACLSKVTPFSISKGGQKDVPQIRELHLLQRSIIDFDIPANELDMTLPDLRPLELHGCFRNLRSISIAGWMDQTFTIPALFAPLSPIRSRIENMTLVALPESVVNIVSLSFILDATTYLPASYFVARPIVSLSEVLPDTHHFCHPFGPDDVSLSEVDAEGGPCASILAKARTDFGVFVSLWDDEDSATIITRLGDLSDRRIDECSPFERLSSLSLTISDAVHIVLLLGTKNFPRLKVLRLQGITLVISSYQFTLLRRSVSRSDSDLAEYGTEGACTHSFGTNAGLTYPRHEELQPWHPLSKSAVEAFGTYQGPRLELLDVLFAALVIIDSNLVA
ncbi:hypothetical protein JCM16303_004950 [Sporobolomyces ruberrimus]